METTEEQIEARIAALKSARAKQLMCKLRSSLFDLMALVEKEDGVLVINKRVTKNYQEAILRNARRALCLTKPRGDSK